MDYPKEILVKEYFNIHNYYSSIYGHGRTIILMQVGAFHESYCTDKDGLNLDQLAQDLDVICTAKNKKEPISKSNPKMLGFPIYVLDNFIEKLIDLNYTIVVIDQVTDPPNPKRKVTRIESPGTFISKTKNFNPGVGNNIISLFFDKISTSSNFLCVGMSSYDISTGVGYFYESYSKKEDINIALDDTIRFLEINPPQEIIIYFNFDGEEKVSNMNHDEIISYLKIKESMIYYIEDYKKYKKIKFQKDVLNKVFNFMNQVDIFENIDIEKLNWARTSLTGLLDYVNNHQSKLLNRLQPPKLFINDNNLYLGNRAIEQLNVTPTGNCNKSLYNIISSVKTILGKRFLRNQLSNPISNIDTLLKRYSLIDGFISESMDVKINPYLENILDIDKIIRKMEIEIVHPSELSQMIKSLKNFDDLISEIGDEFYDKFEFNGRDNLLREFLSDCNKVFNLDRIEKINFVNYIEDDASFFNKGIYKEIDSLEEQINTSNNFLELLVKELSSYIDEKNYFNKTKELLSVKFNERDGHYIIITNRRLKLLQDKFKKLKLKKLNIGGIELTLDDLEFIPQPRSSNTKINCKKLKDLSIELVTLKKKLADVLKNKFYQEVKKLVNVYSDDFHFFSFKIAEIDFINSGAITAKKLGYCKPIIESCEFSFIDAKELRHPIVESINDNFIYQPHDISLGKEIKGMLLYGINSSGKSTLMKSIGLNVILAQIGYFVAAKEFRYSPYTSLFTRISGNDDIYRGLSSFMVEMIELMSILKRNNERTLVIGDEICRGTEEKSANIIVAYMLESLEKSNTSFITATHLHRIANLPCVKSLVKVKPFHLKVDYDDENEKIIYQRTLMEGQGESFYGLQVAKYLMKDKEFNNRTLEIMHEFDQNGKKSKYNSDLTLEECYFCKCNENLECHHINWQKDFNKDNVNILKPHIKKNKIYNLLVVCQVCHDKIDRNEITTKDWIMTSDGLELDYSFNEEKTKKLKYNNEIITKVFNLKNKYSLAKEAKVFIKKSLDINMSTSTIKKIWDNTYDTCKNIKSA